MSTFLLSYRSPSNPAPASAEAMEAWNTWFGALGASVTDMGKPIFVRSTIGNCDADTALGGYSLISADDLQAALAMAEGCPLLQNGGGVEVGELADIG